MILYYSGTGNSKYIAEKTAELTGDTVVDLNSRIKSADHSALELTEKDQGKLIISVPTYAWRIPRIVEKWINETPFKGVQNIWFIMNCGDGIGTASSFNEKLCKSKGTTYMGTMQIIMPENYVAMFKVPKDSTARKIIANANPAINEAAELICSGKNFPEPKHSLLDHIYSKAVNPIFYKLFVKADSFRTTETCTGCGKCASLCPMNNITIKDKRPSWGSSCTHCMACICRCPFEAIEYGTKSQGKPRYYNPFTG